MTLNKKERGVTIGIGVTIGVVLSWGLLTRWKEDRDELEQNLPGHYDSNLTAYGRPLAASPPMAIREKYPGSRILHHVAEANASVTLPGEDAPQNIWILSTKTGRYKFVRVEQEAIDDGNGTSTEWNLYRGAEIFAWTRPGVSEDELRDILESGSYNLIGKNERRGYLIQCRDVSPAGLPAAMRELLEKPIIEKVEPCLIE